MFLFYKQMVQQINKFVIKVFVDIAFFTVFYNKFDEMSMY